MGIPGLFAHLYNHVLDMTTSNLPREKVEWLMLDMNGIIHTSAQKAIFENNGKENITDIVKYIVTEIRQIILAQNNPSIRVYLAVDGVAPIAKQKQQRLRRYRSAYIREKKREIYNSYREKFPKHLEWDSNQISAGTPFMKKITDMIYLEFLDEIKTGRYILSDSLEQGEGEHKIFEFLRKETTKQTVVIHGLDADLILLSLLSHHDILLYRERKFFSNERENLSQMIYLDINTLRLYLVDELKSKTRDNPELLIKDFIAMASLLGNDFLPNVPTLNIYDEGIYHLLVAYKDLDMYLIEHDKNTLNMKAWELFMNILDKNTEVRGKEQTHKTKKSKPRRFVPETTMTPKEFSLKKKIHDFENNSEFINQVLIDFDTTDYYEKYNKEYVLDANTLSESYFQGIYWVYLYYSQGCPSQLYTYSSEYAPMLKDLIEKSKTYEVIPFVPTADNISSIKKQLMYINPKSSASVLGLSPQEVVFMQKTYPEPLSLKTQSFGHRNLHHMIIELHF